MAEIFCPVCKYKNEADAKTCVFCGSPLAKHDDSPSTTRNVATGEFPQEVKETPPRLFEPPKQGIALYSADADLPVIVQNADQFVLGRKMTGEIDESFVDLRPFGAYENGVSRRHAMIRRAGGKYEIVDLGSTNGTWIEKQRIVPNRPYPLNSGAIIFLGRLQLHIIYRAPSS